MRHPLDWYDVVHIAHSTLRLCITTCYFFVFMPLSFDRGKCYGGAMQGEVGCAAKRTNGSGCRIVQRCFRNAKGESNGPSLDAFDPDEMRFSIVFDGEPRHLDCNFGRSSSTNVSRGMSASPKAQKKRRKRPDALRGQSPPRKSAGAAKKKQSGGMPVDWAAVRKVCILLCLSCCGGRTWRIGFTKLSRSRFSNTLVVEGDRRGAECK